MRPGQSCPGVEIRADELGAEEDVASMRPGQSCPGVVPEILAIDQGLTNASMRPGQSCPGVECAGDHEGSSLGRGFNEAGAIMPRSGWDST